MKKRNLFSVFGLLFLTFTGFSQNADILWTNKGAANGRDYVGASFVIDSAAVATVNRGIVVVAKNWDSLPVGTKRALSVDQFNTTGFWIGAWHNQQANLPTEKIMPVKIVKALTTAGTQRYYALGYVDNSPKPTNGFMTQSTNTILSLDGNFNILAQFKIHYQTITALKAPHYLRFFDMIVLADGHLALCGYYAQSSTSQKQLLLCKVTNTGAVIWSGIYPNSLNCNTIGYSLVESSSGRIVVTGPMDSCVNGALTGNKKLFVAKFNGTNGAFMNAVRYNNGTKDIIGNKIVRLQVGAAAGNDRFMITGLIDVNAMGVAANRQILFLDVNEPALTPNSMHWLGGARGEVGNDLIFRKHNATSYSLYVTGPTNSYNAAARDQAYFLRTRYTTATSNMALSEFSTFPGNTSYLGRYGLEIKKAAGAKFAILTNTLMPTGGGQNRLYTNMLIRDTADISNNCIALQVPTLAKINPLYQGVNFTKLDTLRSYADTWILPDTVKRDSICGVFLVDPKTATGVAGNTDQIVRTYNTGTIDELGVALPGLNVYPNPAREKLVVSWNSQAEPGKVVNVQVFNPQMKLVQVKEIRSGNTIQLPISHLSAGIYFLRIQTAEKTGILRFVKQ